MNQASANTPRIENGKPMLVAGLRSHYTAETMKNVAAQWQRFASYIGRIPGQVDGSAYGLCLNTSSPNGIDYISGVEVSGSSVLPSELSTVRIPGQRYAVFLHHDHVSRLPETFDAIWRKWLPASGYQTVPAAEGAPQFFEKYTESFDPQTGMGGIEIWIPIKS